MLEKPVLEGLHPVERDPLQQFVESCKPMGWTHVGEVNGELSPMGGTTHWSRGRTEQGQKHRVMT